MRFAWRHVDDSPFVDGWHIKAACDHLQAVFEGKIDNLLINIPPGCGKSLIVSVFWPVWCWVKRPSSRFLCASYGQELSTRDAVKARYLMASSWFQLRWGHLFRFAADQNAKTRYENDKKGWRLATSVGGRVTGEHPDFIVIDDPHNASESLSEASRKEVADWWSGAVSTRGVARGVRKVVIMQRLHEDDLSGIILKAGGFVHLCLPMRFEQGRMTETPIGWNDPRQEEGELLFPDVFSDATVTMLEKSLGRAAAGQLQQRPTPKEGDIFKASWFRYFTRQDDVYVTSDGKRYRIRDCWTFATVDLAVSQKQTADWTVLQAYDVASDGSAFLKDQRRERMDAPTTVEAIKTFSAKNQCDWIGVESVAFQLAIVQMVRREGLSVKELPAKGDKVSRAHAAANRLAGGNVYFSAGASWLTDLESELLSFPNGSHDDQCDALSHACIEINKSSAGTKNKGGIVDVGNKANEFRRQMKGWLGS